MKPALNAIKPALSSRAHPRRRSTAPAFLALVALLTWSLGTAPARAASTPSQVPLFSAISGAKPNLMFVLDNSGSMSFEYPEGGYTMNNDCKDGSGSSGNCNQKNGWYAMRSSQINNHYYNPATTYLARVNADGTSMVNPLIFVDNQNSGTFSYTAPQGGYSINQSVYVPKYTEYTNGNAVPTNAKFTYVKCGDATCTAANRSIVHISYPAGSGTIVLPSGHNRTDCGANTTSCSATRELQNILNWYQWYRNRALAVETAVGQALQSYDNKFRIGYLQYNAIKTNSYSVANSIVRGVRVFHDDTGQPWKTQFYNWLYGIVPAGGTNSHNALALAANYYAGSGSNRSNYGNPWKNDPTSTAAEKSTDDLSCRRAYSIVLSDGAWNSGTSSKPDQYASKTGTNYSGNPLDNSAALQYDPSGASGWNSADTQKKLAARNLYIPYSDNKISRNGFADLTALYFWDTDFSALPNNVPPVSGQNNPTFWQNMTTYTIGWGLVPTGDGGKAGGLTWSQIRQYNNDWLAGNSVTLPKWADGETSIDLNDSNTAESLRVNDFIRAGFTGGGKAYSVFSGDDVRRAIDDALSGMVGSGNDAGVAVSGNSGEFQTLEDQQKFTTEYKTADNTGDIKAYLLDSNGGYAQVNAGIPIPAWSADQKMPAANLRKIFALSSYDANAPSTAANLRQELNNSTSLSSLPSDFQALLNANGLQKSDQTFIRYMLGQDGLSDTTGAVYRLRGQPIGASVNSPPVFVGGRTNMGYSQYGSVAGKADYGAYLTSKRTLPATIFAATNDGKVHVLNAAKTDTALTVGGVAVPAGTEVTSFMPKGSMASQIDLASPSFRFRYVLDGPLVEHDLYDSKGNQLPGVSGSAWHQLVFGTGGRAGKFMYGLQSPLNSADRVPTKNDFLWELDSTTTGYGDLGYVTNNPTAGQLDDGTWVMLVGSGHYAGAGKNVGLYVVDAFSGKLVQFIALPSGYRDSATNRGLGTVVALRDANRKIVAAYAGDANGNLWRFDLRSGKMKVSYNRPLFTTLQGKKQPIYASPAWQPHPGDGATCTTSSSQQCGTIVVVGTGILLDEDDLATPATAQAIYGIWDPTPIGGDDKPTATQVVASDLVTQTINLGSVVSGVGAQSVGKSYYQISTNSVDWTTKKGWKIDLGVITYPGTMANGERVVGDLSNLGSSVWVTSFLPEEKNLSIESCTATGSLPNVMYLIDALTGGNKRSFDINSDGRADFYSIVKIPSGGFNRGNMASRNALGLAPEGRPDLKPQTTCTNETGYNTGVGGTVAGFDACDSQGWRRSWRQVVKPPF